MGGPGQEMYLREEKIWGVETELEGSEITAVDLDALELELRRYNRKAIERFTGLKMCVDI